MLVRLDDIPTRGLDVVLGAWALPMCAVGLDGKDATCTGTLRVTRHDRHIFVRGHLEGAADVVCDRCGGPLRMQRVVDVACLYSPMELVPERSEEEEAVPELPDDVPVAECELGEYDGVALHLGEVVRETFVLERPARVRCADELGEAADAACLERWTARAAPHREDEVDPRFAVLRNFRQDS